jgi:hypothetical protein
MWAACSHELYKKWPNFYEKIMKRKCPDQGTLFAYLDRELDQTFSQKIEKHVEVCPFCHENLQNLKSDKEFVFAQVSILNPPLTAVPQWSKTTLLRPRPAQVSTLELILSILKNNLKPALAIMGMLLVTFFIKEKITTKSEDGRSHGERYAMDTLTVRHTPHDSSLYAQWLKTVDDTTLIKLLLKSKGDATIVHL